MPDQTPATDDDRTLDDNALRALHEWAAGRRMWEREGGELSRFIAPIVEAIEIYVPHPAPPATLAEELREWGARPLGGLNWTRFHDLADRVEAVVQERDKAQQDAVDAWEHAAQTDRDHVRAMGLWEQDYARVLDERDEARAEVERLTREGTSNRNAARLERDTDHPNRFGTALPDPADVPEGEMWLIHIQEGQALAGIRSLDGSWSVLAYNGFAREDDLVDEQVTLVSRLVPETRRVIDKAEALDALPVRSIIRDGRGWPGGVTDQGLLMVNGRVYGNEDLIAYGKVTVLWEPEVTA